MPDTETLTPDQLKEIEKRIDAFPLSPFQARALCRSQGAARADLRQGALCEECDQWENNQDGNPRTFMVCGACWNESQKTIAALRQQLATQAESITYFQENEKSLKAQLAQVQQERNARHERT